MIAEKIIETNDRLSRIVWIFAEDVYVVADLNAIFGWRDKTIFGFLLEDLI
jgi:hypothetical protein